MNQFIGILLVLSLLQISLACNDQALPCSQTQQCIDNCEQFQCDDECIQDIAQFSDCEHTLPACQQGSAALEQCTPDNFNYQYPEVAYTCFNTCNQSFKPKSAQYVSFTQCLNNCMPCYNPDPYPVPPGSNANLKQAVQCITNNCAKSCQSWNQQCMECDDAFSQAITKDPICEQAFIEWETLSKQANINQFTVPQEFTQCYAAAKGNCTETFFNQYFIGCQLQCLITATPLFTGQQLQNLYNYNQLYATCPSCIQTANYSNCQAEQTTFNQCIVNTNEQVCVQAANAINYTNPSMTYPFSMVACNQTCAPNSTQSDFYQITQCWLSKAYIQPTPPSPSSSSQILQILISLIIVSLGIILN